MLKHGQDEATDTMGQRAQMTPLDADVEFVNPYMIGMEEKASLQNNVSPNCNVVKECRK